MVFGALINFNPHFPSVLQHGVLMALAFEHNRGASWWNTSFASTT